MVIGAQELEDRDGLGGFRGPYESRGDGPGEQRGRGDVAVVGLVAHLERLAGQAAQVDRSTLADRDREGRSDHLGEPAQPLEDRGVVGAEPEDLAESLVERRVGACPGRHVLDHDHRHRRADDPGHRADRAVVVARREFDVTGLDQRQGVVRRRGPTLEQDRPGDRRPSPVRTSGPTRWAAPSGGSGDRSSPSASRAGWISMSIGWAASSRSSAVALAAATRRPIGSSGSSSSRASSRPRSRSPSAGGRQSRVAMAAPLAATGGANMSSPTFTARIPSGKNVDSGTVLTAGPLPPQVPVRTMAAAIRAARALLVARMTPAPARVASWAARPCGSAAVPQTEATTAIVPARAGRLDGGHQRSGRVRT